MFLNKFVFIEIDFFIYPLIWLVLTLRLCQKFLLDIQLFACKVSSKSDLTEPISGRFFVLTCFCCGANFSRSQLFDPEVIVVLTILVVLGSRAIFTGGVNLLTKHVIERWCQNKFWSNVDISVNLPVRTGPLDRSTVFFWYVESEYWNVGLIFGAIFE